MNVMTVGGIVLVLMSGAFLILAIALWARRSAALTYGGLAVNETREAVKWAYWACMTFAVASLVLLGSIWL